MSIHRLNTFIKENSHDIVDYWVYRHTVHYVRVVSRKSGWLYMVRVQSYNISLGEDRESLRKTPVFYLDQVDENDPVPPDLHRLYDTFLSAFPEHRDRFLVHHSNFFIDARESIRRISNYPSDGYFNMYLFIELEWFYENLYIVNHEMDRSFSNIMHKCQKIYDGFLPMYSGFVRKPEKDIEVVQNVWVYFQEQKQLYEKSQRFFVQLCQSEYKYHQELIELNHIRTDELSFQDTVRRTHKRKMLQDKLTKLRPLHVSAMERLVYGHTLQNHLMLRFLYFLADITLLLTKFHAHFLELENLIPKKASLDLG